MASFVASIYPFELDSVSSGLQLIEQFLLSHWIHLQEPLLLSTLPFRSSRLLDDQWKKPCPQKGQVIRGPFQVAEDWLSEWFAENFAVSFQVQTLRVGLCSQHGVCSSGNLAPPGELQRGLHSQPSSENGLEMLVISCGINLQLFDAFSVAQLPQRLDILKTSILFLGSWKLLEYQGAPCPSLPSAQTGGHTVTAGGCAGWRWPAKKKQRPANETWLWLTQHRCSDVVLLCFFVFLCLVVPLVAIWEAISVQWLQKMSSLLHFRPIAVAALCRTSVKAGRPATNPFPSPVPPQSILNQAKLARLRISQSRHEAPNGEEIFTRSSQKDLLEDITRSELLWISEHPKHF